MIAASSGKTFGKTDPVLFHIKQSEREIKHMAVSYHPHDPSSVKQLIEIVVVTLLGTLIVYTYFG